MTISVLLLLLLVVSVDCQLLFLSETAGNDSSAGTQSAPLLTLAAAASRLQPGGNASLLLDGHFESCFVALNGSAHLFVQALSGTATIGCSTPLNATTAGGATAALLLAASASVSVVNVTFAGFSVYNASAVELRSLRVELVNVTFADIAVVADTSEDTFGTVDDAVLRSPLAVDAARFVASNCTFQRNSLRLITQALGLSPVTIFGDWRGGNATTLPVPGGGALACRCASFAIAASVFECNSVNATPLSWLELEPIGPDLAIPGDRSAACGGSVLVLASGSGSGTLSGCTFRNSSISASIASGGAVAVVANGPFQLNVTASSFRGSSLAGSMLSGADLVIVRCSGGGDGGALQLDNATFHGALVSGKRFNGVVRAPSVLLATNVSVSSVSCGASIVACGMLCAVDIDVFNGSICDNAIESNHVSGGLIGNGQWEADSALCSTVVLVATRIERNRLLAGQCTLVQQSCAHALDNYAALLLREVCFADNNATLDGTSSLTTVALVSATTDVPVEVSFCEFVRNSGFSHVILLRAPSLLFAANNVSDNVLSAFVMDVEFVSSTFRGFTASLSVTDVVVTANAGFGFCNLFVGPQSITSITIARSRIESDVKQLMLVSSLEPLYQFSVLKSVFVRQVVDIRCCVRVISLAGSSMIATSHLFSTSQTRAFAQVSAGVHIDNSTFQDCAPALGVSDADHGVRNFSVRLALPVLISNSHFSSTLARSVDAMIVCGSRAAEFALINTTVEASGQRLATSSACGSLSLNNVSLDSSGGISIAGPFGALLIANSFFTNVVVVALSSIGSTAVLTNVSAVDNQSGFLFRGATEVNVTNFWFRSSALNSPAVAFTAVNTLRISNASISAASFSERGTVSLDTVNHAVLHDVVVANSSARFGGGFGEHALGSVECSGVVARANLATVAGGAVFSDSPNGSFVACVEVVNCTALWWGHKYAGPEERLLVSHADDRAMPGVGLRDVHVQIVDQFGQTVWAAPPDLYQSEPPLKLRSARLLVFATLSCDDNTQAHSLLCVIEPTAADCRGDLPLPAVMAGALCNVSVVADKTTLSADLSLVVQPCQFGFGADSPGRALCAACSADTISVGGESLCTPCPLGARCCGADRVTSRPDFFVVLDSFRVAAVPCLPGACLGFNSSCADQASTRAAAGVSAAGISENMLNQCAPGRTGLLCAHCNDTDSVPVAPNNGITCVPCTAPNPWAVIALVVGLLSFAAIVHVNAVGNSAALKILLYFTQIASAQAPVGLFTGALHLFFGFQVAAASGAFGGICVFAGFRHFSLVAVRLSLPAALLSGLLLIAVGARVVRWRRGAREADDAGGGGGGGAALAVESIAATASPLFGWRRVLRTCVSIVLLTFSVCLSASLDVLHCVQLRDGESFLVSDVRESCDSDEALTWRRAAAFGLIPLAALVIVAVPVALLLLRRRHGHLQHDIAGVLFDCYSGAPCRIGFESFTLLRRMAVGLAAAFVADALLRRFLFTLINVVSLLIVVLVRPYVVGAENHLDAVAQLFLVLLGTTELTGTGVGDTLIAVASAIPVVLIVGFMLQGHARKARLWCIGRRQKSR
jgi:hypothetical protein